MLDGTKHYKLYLLKLTMAVDNFVFKIIKGAFEYLYTSPWWVYLGVSECIFVSADMLPYCSVHDECLIMKLLQVCQVQYCQQCVNC